MTWAVPLTGHLAPVLSSTPSAPWLNRSSFDPVFTSLLSGRNWLLFLWRLPTASIVDGEREERVFLCGCGRGPSCSGCGSSDGGATSPTWETVPLHIVQQPHNPRPYPVRSPRVHWHRFGFLLCSPIWPVGEELLRFSFKKKIM